MINFLNNNKINIFFLLGYLIITVISLCFHEIWQDEGQAWCIARDLNIIDLYKTTRIEGHPLLWYLVLMPFAKLDLPVISMQILSLLFVFASVILILFKSNCNYFEKFFICFSAGMLYYLPTVARSYSLIPLILFLMAVLWRDKTKHGGIFVLLIILLINTHLYMLGLAFAIFSVFLYEVFKQYKNEKNPKNLYWSILPVLCFIFIFLTFYNVNSQNTLYLMN